MRGRTAAVLLLAAIVSSCGDTDSAGDAEPPPRTIAAPPLKPLPPGHLPKGKGFVLARVRAPVVVYDGPNGRPFARLRPKTPFDGPRTLGVLEVRDKRRWLGVHSPVLPNDRLGWVPNDPHTLDLTRTRVSLRVSLGARRIVLRRGEKTLREIPISIGAAGTSTPAGRFQVTDKMPASRFPKGPYGCCIIALSARQPNLPPGWAGGDRIAIHGTPNQQSIGSASSNGCLRATDADLRVLMRDVPIGAPVFIRP